MPKRSDLDVKQYISKYAKDQGIKVGDAEAYFMRLGASKHNATTAWALKQKQKQKQKKPKKKG